ncbi:putative translation Initiation factor eIF-4e [Rosa chinensis]|uniref:Eukaryotic translation initiation factor 4E-1 n=1 Tax=Rosa chinensis TaxID=74649 RepID=A0A2P6SGA0_ROSCH|nr:putative translation Initiation factor eIF-4e [Rosa chinensis]
MTIHGCLQALIGEQFDHGDEICGAVVNVRNRQKKIALWTKNAANEAAQVSIGKQWKGILESNETIGFIFHVRISIQVCYLLIYSNHVKLYK